MLDLELQFDIREAFDVLEDNGYKVVEKMGKGGFGSCYRVKNMKNKNYEQTFVCKVTNDRESFERELSILKCVDNANIVRCYDYFEDTKYNKYYYLILEDCAHGNLLQRIKKQGPLSYRQFVTFSYQLVRAVSFLHQNNVCHFDIKPSNIFLTEYDTIKLGDFGLSTVCKPGEEVKTYRGTQNFTAPEVFEKIPYDPFKADIYSLGVTLYTMLSAQLPFKQYSDFKHYLNTGEVQLSSQYPKEVTDFIRDCIALAPSSRPSIQEIVKFFDDLAHPNAFGMSLANSTSLLHIKSGSPRIICPLLKQKIAVKHNISMRSLNNLINSNLKHSF